MVTLKNDTRQVHSPDSVSYRGSYFKYIGRAACVYVPVRAWVPVPLQGAAARGWDAAATCFGPVRFEARVPPLEALPGCPAECGCRVLPTIIFCFLGSMLA